MSLSRSLASFNAPRTHVSHATVLAPLPRCVSVHSLLFFAFDASARRSAVFSGRAQRVACRVLRVLSVVFMQACSCVRECLYYHGTSGTTLPVEGARHLRLLEPSANWSGIILLCGDWGPAVGAGAVKKQAARWPPSRSESVWSQLQRYSWYEGGSSDGCVETRIPRANAAERMRIRREHAECCNGRRGGVEEHVLVQCGEYTRSPEDHLHVPSHGAQPSRANASHGAMCNGSKSSIPQWDHEICASCWRWAGHAARLAERCPERWSSKILGWKDAWWRQTLRYMHGGSADRLGHRDRMLDKRCWDEFIRPARYLGKSSRRTARHGDPSRQPP